MVDSLILHPTETSQWHALLNEAQALTECYLDEEIESYLVFLLMRFSQTPDLSSSVLAMDFLEAKQVRGQQKIERLQQLGDKSLLFSGLYPGLAEKKLVSVDYFIHIGTSAYYSAANLESYKNCNLYNALGKEFVMMATVLNKLQPPGGCSL
jgi:hypothetical protein